MTERAQKLKAIVKGTAPQATYGTNPMDPWSAKANMAEDATLNKYLMSRGINPKYATKDQKVAHSKTGAFITWKNSRMLEDTLEERVDKKDTVTLDIPLLIRVLELAREDIKTDMDLHRVVEKLINIRNKGMLTMKDYNYIAKIHEEVMSQVSQEIIDEGRNDTPVPYGSLSNRPSSATVAQTGPRKGMITKKHATRLKDRIKASLSKEEVEPIDEITTTGYHKAAVKSRMDAAVKVASSMGKDKAAKTKLDARNRGLNRLSDRTSAEMKKANSGPQKPREVKTPTDAEQRGYGQGRYMGDSVEHDNTTMVEAQSAAVRFQRALENAKKKREEQERRNKENAERALAPKPVQEAACACEMTKSARIIKSLYKKKGVSEDMYDHEKEDKSVATYGKKPKMAVTSKESSFGEKKPDAAAVLTGGTTLTGQKRDTVEIDPMMRKRPGSDPTGKNK